jgi:hypothetical protein
VLCLQVTASIHGKVRLTLQEGTATWEFLPAADATGESGELQAEVCSCGARIDGHGDLDVVRKAEALAASLPNSPCDVRIQILQGSGTARVVEPADPAGVEPVIVEFSNGHREDTCEHIVRLDFILRPEGPKTRQLAIVRGQVSSKKVGMPGAQRSRRIADVAPPRVSQILDWLP